MNTFSTEKNSNTSIKVLQLSDMHLFSSPEETLLGVNTEQSFLSVLSLAKANSWPPDVIILTGDLSQDTSKESYARLLSHLVPLGIPCFVLPGNHDTPRSLLETFQHPLVSYQPFLHLGDWLFAFLDSEKPNEEGGTLKEHEIKNLAEEIKKHPLKQVLICLHHQLNDVGSAWIDSMAVDNPDALQALINCTPQIRGIIHGHTHQEFASQLFGAAIFGAPSTCFQFKPHCKEFTIDTLTPGYRWLRLSTSGDIETAVVRLSEGPKNLEQNSDGY